MTNPTNSDKPAILADEVEDFERPDLTAMHRSELEAEVVHQAKLIERFRQGIANIVLGLEDEGDRVYLGSTNDADELSELDAKLTDCGNELFMPWSHGDDLYADLRELRTENAQLREALSTPTPAGDELARELAEAIEQTKVKCPNARYVPVKTESADRILTVLSGNDVLREALEKAAQWFEEYADHHAKLAEVAGFHVGEDRNAKAERNKERAAYLRTALSTTPTKEKPA